MEQISESDWKVFKKLRATALERLSERILGDISTISAEGSKTFHERYLGVASLLEERDTQVAQAFNDLRRSTAISRIATITALGLLTEEEFGKFSQKTQDIVKKIITAYGRPTSASADPLFRSGRRADTA